MRNIFTLFIFFLADKCFSQWTSLNIPSGVRYDDVFFINDSIGWAAGGNSSEIYKTIDGGLNWELQFTSGKYLRSIEFATPSLGFCGSLDSSLYKTIDGGQSWVDISNSIQPKPPGICGLSAPSPTVIYGCGIWSSPAYIIKSVDGGATWTSIDLSSMASALVDIYFISPDTGFVSGMANPFTDGGIILYTTNGGNSWSIKYKTLVAQDYVWKIQSPDGLHFYASIESLPVTANVRFAYSIDNGNNWNTSIVKNTYSYIQTIGFIDSLRGWTGGNSSLFETIDGGLNWYEIVLGSTYNRFFKVNDSTAFLSGEKIYKYSSKSSVGIQDIKIHDDIHSLKAFPIPTNDLLTIELTIKNKTNCQLQLFSSTTQLIQSFYNHPIEVGTKQFSIDMKDLPPQTFFLILKTNEGLIYKEIIKN